jgi:hypothetical protein
MAVSLGKLLLTTKSTQSPTFNFNGGPGREPLVRMAFLEMPLLGSDGAQVRSMVNGTHCEDVEQTELEDESPAATDCIDEASVRAATALKRRMNAIIRYR